MARLSAPLSAPLSARLSAFSYLQIGTHPASGSVGATVECAHFSLSLKEPLVKKGWIWCVLCATLLAGCNTMAGVGQDVQKGGQKLENSAEKAK
ncbi:entericidin B membrane lipoprotein [compost metagenome]